MLLCVLAYMITYVCTYVYEYACKCVWEVWHVCVFFVCLCPLNDKAFRSGEAGSPNSGRQVPEHTHGKSYSVCACVCKYMYVCVCETQSHHTVPDLRQRMCKSEQRWMYFWWSAALNNLGLRLSAAFPFTLSHVCVSVCVFSKSCLSACFCHAIVIYLLHNSTFIFINNPDIH